MFIEHDRTGEPGAEPARRSVGRPSDYDAAYCERVVEWGRIGKSKAWMCSQLEIAKSTMLLWERTHPEFSSAMARAMMHSQAHWEDLGHVNIQERDFNSSVWSRSMAARFPEDWRETTKQETELTGKDGGPITFAQVLGKLTSNVCPNDDSSGS